MKQIIVFAVVENSEGDREIVHYEMSVSQHDYDNGNHYLAACQKAEREGYRVFVTFDSNDMAGKQLLGKSMLYGDKGCYIASLPNSKVGEVLIMETDEENFLKSISADDLPGYTLSNRGVENNTGFYVLPPGGNPLDDRDYLGYFKTDMEALVAARIHRDSAIK